MKILGSTPKIKKKRDSLFKPSYLQNSEKILSDKPLHICIFVGICSLRNWDYVKEPLN